MSTHILTDIRVAVYARYSSASQREASIEDQVRRCGDFIARAGGVVDPNLVFADHAVSGASLQRPAFEKLMSMVTAKHRQIDVIVTEDISRISRDFADAATVLRELLYYGVALMGATDGVDTSNADGETMFMINSIFAQRTIKDLRQKTLRGLEGRALAGYSTGGLPHGFRSHPEVDAHRRVVGYVIAIDEGSAGVVRRIFDGYLAGRSLVALAAELNATQVPPPRAHTQHRRKGWVASTIRDMLHNPTYIGAWAFKKREWRKVPGTNKRRPRARPEKDVIRQDRPELRIISQETWDAVQARLARVRATYTVDAKGNSMGMSAPGRQTHYLFSGLLMCGCCGAPMVIVGGSSSRYYRCGDAHKRRTCVNTLSVKELAVRSVLLATIRSMITTPEAIDHVRERLSERLGTRSQEVTRGLEERRERLARTRQRIDRLTDVIADGERSEALLQKLRDSEAQARDEHASILALEEQLLESPQVPSLTPMVDRVFDLEARLAQDPLRGREELRHYFRGGAVRLEPQPDGAYIARGELLPLAALVAPNVQRPGSSVTSNPAVYSNCCEGRI